MRQFFEQYLDIRRSDWATLFFFLIFNVLLWCGLAMGESLAETLFLKRFSVDFLPHMFLTAALFSIPVTMLYTMLLSRLRPATLDIALWLASVVALTLTIRLLDARVTIHEFEIACPILYLLNTAMTIIWPTHFWVMLSGQLSTLDSKRLLPLIMTGVVGGAFGGGMLVSSMAERTSLSDCLGVWMILLVLTGGWILLGRTKLLAAGPALGPEPDTEPQYLEEDWLTHLKNEIATIFSNRLVSLMVASGLLLTMIRYFIEFQYSQIFVNAFQTENELAQFYGVFAAVTSVLAMGVQTIITTRLIRLMGVANANFIYPCCTLGAMIGLAATARLGAGIFARFTQDALRRALFQPVASLMYNAVPPKKRNRAIAINEGFVVEGGTIIAALFLIQFGSNSMVLGLSGIVLATGFVYVNWRMRGEYTASLMQLLRSSRFEVLAEERQELGHLDQATEKLVIEALGDENDEVVALAGELLARWGRPDAREAILQQVRLGRIASRPLLIKFLDRFPAPEVMSCLREQLTFDHPEVQLSVLQVLGRNELEMSVRERVVPFLRHQDERLRAAAIVPLLKQGDLDQMLGALETLRALLNAERASSRILGIAVVEELGDVRYWDNLSVLLHDIDPSVRIAVMRALEQMAVKHQAAAIVHQVIVMAGDPVREVRAAALRVLGNIKHEEGLPALLHALNDPSPRNRALAQDMVAGLGEAVYPHLWRILQDEAAGVRMHQSVVGILGRSLDPEVRERLYLYGQARIEQLYRLAIDRHVVLTGLDRATGEYLAMVLEEKVMAMLRLLLALVAPRERLDALRTVYKKIRSTDRELSSNAIEVLQNLGERRLIYNLLPILEDLPVEDVARYGVQRYRIEPGDIRGILGRHLLSRDHELRIAAVYTIGLVGMNDLSAALGKLLANADTCSDFANVARWTLDRLTNGRLCNAGSPPMPVAGTLVGTGAPS